THAHIGCEEGTDPLAVTAPTRSAKHQRHAPPLRTGHRGQALAQCNTSHTQQGKTDSERERDMNGCRQEALTINLARERAPTPPATRGSGSSSSHDAAPTLFAHSTLNEMRCFTPRDEMG
ncbi:exo-alpha-sialidase, partial [Trypanosoma cruzi]